MVTASHTLDDLGRFMRQICLFLEVVELRIMHIMDVTSPIIYFFESIRDFITDSHSNI
ncbi:MAG: hypothetical protein E6600_10110 [Anaerocolumna aminovalerica]|uniref:hypothetical protein n=1 Tax=Anaerocolumna aminovalerica TaxID=1527 RepID=UPI001596AE07|nr:hypothetical protein [Anaerocolumna aminovalerica]MBU5332763.1 hypothetical protein [Anaerocolumna aminovalerica]MDU6264843.1 hypothetical protein [Anaerocolumna aminovalerica]